MFDTLTRANATHNNYGDEPGSTTPLADPLETALLVAVQEPTFGRHLKETAKTTGLYGLHVITHVEDLWSVHGGHSGLKGVRLTIDGHHYDLHIRYAGPAPGNRSPRPALRPR